METAAELPPQAYWLAFGRWPGITPETKVVIANWNRMIIPVFEEDTRSLMERWTSPYPDNGWPSFRQEEIVIDRVTGCEPVTGMGYGPETKTLVVRLAD